MTSWILMPTAQWKQAKTRKWTTSNEKLCTAEIINRMKRQPTEWQKIFANSKSDKWFIFKIYKELLHPQQQIIIMWFKNGQGALSGVFLWIRHTNAVYEYRQIVDEKRCSVLLIIREMQLKTLMRYPSHLSRWLLFLKSDIKCW